MYTNTHTYGIVDVHLRHFHPQVNIHLSKEGLAQVDDVVAAVFEYIAMLRFVLASLGLTSLVLDVSGPSVSCSE